MIIEHYHPNNFLSLETPVAFQQNYKTSKKIYIFYVDENIFPFCSHTYTVAIWRYKPKTNEIPRDNRTSL